jgi:quercetin dioxygenase-like cupin family protein
MAIRRNLKYVPLSKMDDPDDYRPNSRLAFAVDPGDGEGRVVRSLGFIFEVVGPGDAVALHRHATDEAIFVEDGQLEVRIGDHVETIGPEEVAFIPRNVPHSWRNLGSRDLKLRGIFPSDVIPIEMLKRTPAPGTEGNPPQPPTRIDMRTFDTG